MIARNGTFAARATIYVSNGGITSDAHLLDYLTTECVSSGGRSVSTIAGSGGLQAVSAGGVTSDTTLGVSGGAEENVYSGGVASDTTVGSGGDLGVFAGGSVTGSDLLSGGSIDLTHAPYARGASYSFNSSTDVLTVTEGGNTCCGAVPIVLRGDGVRISLAHTAPVLEAGFHAPEANFRWTNGDAELPPALFAAFQGPLESLLHAGCIAAYPIEMTSESAVAA